VKLKKFRKRNKNHGIRPAPDRRRRGDWEKEMGRKKIPI